MTDHNQRLEQLLETLIELPPAERATVLERDCSDPEMRAELEELLAHHDADEDEPDFLDSLTGFSNSALSVSRIAYSNLSLPPEHIGPYRVLKKLGAGGMGAVYEVEHSRLRKRFALKVLPESHLQKPRILERFHREMESAGKLQHENVVTASDAGEDKGCHYLVMELVEGPSLSALAARHRQLPVAEACELIRQAAAGVQHAHDRGLIHRDLKPANLMLTREGCVKVLDFGLARLHDSDSETLTATNHVMGTPDYMAPEQGRSAHNVDGRADVYALGATLFKLLTGRAPLEDQHDPSLMRKLQALATESAPSIGTLRQDLPIRLVRLVDRMVARDPDSRPSTPGEVAEALTEFADGHDVAGLLNAPPVSDSATTVVSQPRTRPLQRPRHSIAIILAVVIVPLISLAVWHGIAEPQGDDGQPEALTADTDPAADNPLDGSQPSGPIIRTVASWPYLYCLSDRPIDRIGSDIEKVYSLCDQHNLDRADDSITLVYLSWEDHTNVSSRSSTEIRIRLNDWYDEKQAAVRATAKRLGLKRVGFNRSPGGQEACLTKPIGVSLAEVEPLWLQLYQFVDEEHETDTYTAPMERIPPSEWDADYADIETELIIPLE